MPQFFNHALLQPISFLRATKLFSQGNDFYSQYTFQGKVLGYKLFQHYQSVINL